MLSNIHIKNFAIIDDADIDFFDNLNIMTGETGAGKSILIEGISIALGGRISGNMIGKDKESAGVEVVFDITDDSIKEKLAELQIYPEEGQVIISRKLYNNRSINKINGENVTVALIKKVANLCIDIHGQHENQLLFDKSYHLDVLDAYAGEEALDLREKIADTYKSYKTLKDELDEAMRDEADKNREISFLEYEKNEIEELDLKPGEEEELEEYLKKLSNASNIIEACSGAHSLMSDGGVSDKVSEALRLLGGVEDYDDNLKGLSEQMATIESLVNDFNRELSEFNDSFSFDEAEFVNTENRLDKIRSCMARYGNSYEEVMKYLEDIDKKLEKYANFDEYIAKCNKQIEDLEAELEKQSLKLTKIRKKTATGLQKAIEGHLTDLNFKDPIFKIDFEGIEGYSEHGKEGIQFLIATNPGMEPAPLKNVASGGELSRVMLAIKTVFANLDKSKTLIFDEIDTGISGRTAQKVSEKLALLSKNNQIICITHLAQIAAMADNHYSIEKHTDTAKNKTTTQVRKLTLDESVGELARILGGVEITDAVMENAREMKKLADDVKRSK